MAGLLTPVGIRRYRLANTEFVSAMGAQDSTPSRFFVRKPPEMLESYHLLRDKLRFARILQLTGRDSGGSALTLLVGAPSKLVSISTSAAEPSALVEFAQLRGVERSLRVYHDVPQDDRSRLATIAASEFGAGELDVVIDDVSNRFPLACSAFEALFPLLRSGGRYILEGWALGHKMGLAMSARTGMSAQERAAAVKHSLALYGTPLEAILPLLVAASRAAPELIPEVTVGPFWIEVRRGPDTIDPATFRLAALAES